MTTGILKGTLQIFIAGSLLIVGTTSYAQHNMKAKNVGEERQ